MFAPGTVAWLDQGDEFVPVRVLDGTSVRSARVVPCAPDGSSLPGMAERPARPGYLHDEATMRRLVALRELLAPAGAADAESGGHPDAVFAFDVVAALRNDRWKAITHAQYRHGQWRHVLLAAAARDAARIAGWDEDVLTWHPAVRVVPAELNLEYADEDGGPTDDAVVAPEHVVVALARDLARADPGLLDVVADREDALRSDGASTLRAWRRDLVATGPPGGATGPAADLDVGIALLRSSGFADMPSVRTALARFEAALRARPDDQ